MPLLPGTRPPEELAHKMGTVPKILYIKRVKQITSQMSVTLTANYKEIFNTQTVEKIDELLDESYDLSAILEFIDENSEEDFNNHYEDYVTAGEAIGYEAVDAYIGENGFCDIDTLEDRFQGCYESTADFAEQFTNDCYGLPELPAFVMIDWEATWDRGLYYDFTACEVSYREVYIFSDN